jgi:PIN domain nuclease of toxin-antitoxin system
MNQPLLLDTCAAIWLMENEYMTDAAVEAIDTCFDCGRLVYVSPVTAWEIGTMARKKRFKSALSPQRWFERLRNTPGIQLCDLSADILLGSSFLPGPIHKDPADRILAATAREFGYMVMTRDRALLQYAAEGYLAAIEC